MSPLLEEFFADLTSLSFFEFLSFFFDVFPAFLRALFFLIRRTRSVREESGKMANKPREEKEKIVPRRARPGHHRDPSALHAFRDVLPAFSIETGQGQVPPVEDPDVAAQPGKDAGELQGDVTGPDQHNGAPRRARPPGQGQIL